MLEELQQRLREMQGQAGVRVVFGEVMEIEGRKVIPVASVAYGFGLGGGQAPKAGGDGATGGGGGGGLRVEPLALVEVAEGRLRVQPIVNVTRLAILGMLLVAWNVFWITRTIGVSVRARARGGG
ncbi:MAG: spore germination protein GerW family protein [Armatimonadota bacterium]|nr:spore germination protein GerW family protein [Armatimonadota bacterium]MDR7427679.1 spore germination protein GerW family protein [Armatimonadota bacterium]MDR7464005.1 spore germination protein GerW family protein [Armatimonadota bacterium]MDR7470294.1 spore germination protein GerW family protein [Armatimonadota bacterium]MDR7475393.1 spore germination protein GerW family protein [Armatimonadota bacterium]